MAAFEISANGERRFAGDDVTAITLVADRVDRRQTERVCVHVGTGVRSLVAGPQVAICDACLAGFDAVITRGAALPMGAFLRDHGDLVCGFCQKSPPAVAALIVRNDAALCPECLHACVDMTKPTGMEE